jgi:hypothetical protein
MSSLVILAVFLAAAFQAELAFQREDRKGWRPKPRRGLPPPYIPQ